jgi:hypothetical protein
MERPSFIATLKQAHHFTIQNFWTFLPLALKTSLSSVIMLIGLIISMSTFLVGLNPLTKYQDTLKSADQVFNLIDWPLFIGGITSAIVFFIGLLFVVSPFCVSLFRRALLGEEIERRYFKRLFATREINYFIAQLKYMGVFGVILLAAGILGGTLFALAVYVQSMIFNIIAGIIGIVALFGFIGVLFFLYARLMFIYPNVVLDHGSNLKTSIVQSRHYTFFLLGIMVLMNLIPSFFRNALEGIVEFIGADKPGIIASLIIFIMFLIIFYYVMIFVTAAISYTYKAVVLKEGAKEEQQVIAPL